MEKKIYIVGAGAIGKTLAVFLKLSNKEVCIIRGSVDDKPAYKEKITVLLNDQSPLETEIEVTSLSSLSELKGLILLTNKSYGNNGLSEKLKNKTNSSPIILLQNGLGVEQPFVKNEFPEIYRCVLFATCQNITESKVKYKPVAASPIGKVKQEETDLKSIVDLLDNPYFKFREEDNIQKVVWQKAIINSVFNSVCPLIEIDNGIFHRDKKSLEIGRNVIKECTSIANAIGIGLDEKEIEEQLLTISKRSDGQFISTFIDIQNKRQTEIDTLNFEIVRIAAALGKEDLVKETKLLGDLVKMKSELNR